MSLGVVCACGAVNPTGAEYCETCGLPALAPKRRHRRRFDRLERTRRGRAGLALLLVVAMVGTGLGVVGVFARRSTAEERARVAKLRADVAAVLPELKQFVEKARGLTFERDVEVEVVDDEEFVARFLGDDRGEQPLVPIPTGRRRPSTRGHTLQALGVVDEAADFDRGLAGLTDAVAGFYDSVSGRLFVRGRDVTPVTKAVLVHELVHALQDQRLGLRELDRGEPGSDRAAAVNALIEGDAGRVEEAYVGTISPADSRAVRASGRIVGAVQGGRKAVNAFVGFSYTAGPGFVRAVVDRRGLSGLDAAYRELPVSTEQIIHPERYLGGQRPVEVPAPPAGGGVLEQGTLGELGLLVALGGDTTREIRDAADGWNGDTYVTYRSGPKTCLRARVLMATPGDRDGLARAFRGRGVTVTDEGTIGLLAESCT